MRGQRADLNLEVMASDRDIGQVDHRRNPPCTGDEHRTKYRRNFLVQLVAWCCGPRPSPSSQAPLRHQPDRPSPPGTPPPKGGIGTANAPPAMLRLTPTTTTPPTERRGAGGAAAIAAGPAKTVHVSPWRLRRTATTGARSPHFIGRIIKIAGSLP